MEEVYIESHKEIIDTDLYFCAEHKLVKELDLFLCNTNLSNSNKTQLIEIIDNVFRAGMDHA